MKMEEKGIDPSTMQRGSSGAPSAAGKKGATHRFNAFKELEREAQGKPAFGSHAEEKKRKREEAEAAKPKRSDPLELEWNGKKITTRPDGTVDPDEVTFADKSVLAFSDAGEGAAWKELKVSDALLHLDVLLD